jgi:hypothetical protein
VARKRSAGRPEVPDWVRAEGFKVSDWAAPEDFSLAPGLAESAAFRRWHQASNAYLTEHPDVWDAVLEELRQMCRGGP